MKRSTNATYFLRYFMIFTLIFISMTLIIFHVMRATMYRNVDANFQEFLKQPESIIAFELEREKLVAVETRVQIEDNRKTIVQSKKQYEQPKLGEQFRLNSNYHIVLYDAEGNVVNNLDLPTKWIAYEFITSDTKQSIEQSVQTIFGDTETYRMMKVAVSSDELTIEKDSEIAYAALLVNTTQIRESITHYEQIVLGVMFAFWLISIGASLYLAKLSMKPLLLSIQKQKEFVENASHELRTPLAVLQNRLEQLFRKPEATIMDSSESIASSLEEVRNMRLLTTNLLNLARRDDGLQVELAAVSPEFIAGILTNFEIIAQENTRRLQIENQITNPIVTDKVLLKQVMTILFDNALKYTEEGGNIFIQTSIKDRYILYRISDDGLGISDVHKKKIFDRFYRVDKARTRQKGGFGLGLSLAQQIVISLNGSISVRDNYPKGTIFEVRIPQKK